tara:strand:- start:1557 stop:2933 length:1377 start_codon:yes stop_codon:yes gene_type:complete
MATIRQILIILILSISFSQDSYIFSENIQLTDTANNQKFPEIMINDGIIHLTWVSIYGASQNVMYSKSVDNGENFSEAVQINHTNNNVISYGQSGPKIEIYNDKIFITYIDDRTGDWSVYMNVSYDNGNSWEQEILISDTPHYNGYQDFEIDTNGNLHLIYYNYSASHHVQDVRYRFASNNDGNWSFNESNPVGIVNDQMEPCDCCQPDLEIDENGSVFIAYRNNMQNIRETYLSIKRFNQDTFSELHQVSNFQDYIPFCPSSGPTIDIEGNQIAVAYTIYDNEKVYVAKSDTNEINFSNYGVASNEDGKQNYPFIDLSDNILVTWSNFINVNSGNWDIYFGVRDFQTNEIINVQKITDDPGNFNQQDSFMCKYENDVYIFWSDQRNGNYEIYYTKGIGQSNILGDINQDFVIDVLDIVSLVEIVLGNLDDINNADLNNDNIINISDVIILINIILGN